MIRKDQEILDTSAIESILGTAKVCRLAMINGNKPYVIPLCFGYHRNTLYFHGALKGLKIDLIRTNPNVCFEFDTLIETIESENACDFSMIYKSVVGTGKAALIESLAEKRRALDIIRSQYSDKEFQYPETMVKATAVIKVEIDSMTGRHSGF